jgi:hypothetical protein
MEDYDGIVGIYSTKNKLTEQLEEKFKQKYLDVKIFTDFNTVDLDKFSYLIINLIDIKNPDTNLLQILRKVTCKVLVVHSLFVKSSENYVTDTKLKELMDANNNLGIILAPDILGKDVEYSETSLSHILIMQALLSERIKLDNSGQFVNTITISKLADRIIKDTFSFGISGQILALIGPRKSKKSFVVKYLGIESQNVITTHETLDIVELHSTASASVDFSLTLAVKNTKGSFKEKTDIRVEESLIPEEEVVIQRKIKNKKKIFNFKVIYNFLIICMFFVSIPFVLILTSLLLGLLSYKYLAKNTDISRSMINVSINLSSLAKELSFGNNLIYDNANIIYEISKLASEGFVLADRSKDLVLKVMSDESFNLEEYSNNISASLEKIHTDISFLQSDINDLGGVTGNYLKGLLISKSVDIGEYKSNIYDTKLLFSRASVLLGQDKPKKYLMLFQNNTELRPTGGFIGSFGLFTFDNGRLTDINISDVYSADGQLKGHVDPPEPIRKYLGEGGWYLRDSNWDPSFPVSSSKAEWFLDKEIGEKVDGVVAIDLNFINKLLTITGPIKLKDFEKTVDQNNLYNLIQNEVENNFFPGSIKKASILTSLSQSLITEVKHLDPKKYFNFFRAMHESLRRKHIQIYMHDENTQKALSNLNFSGEVKLNSDCGLRCFIDSYAIIDANLGVNKSNSFIKRSQDLNLKVSKEEISRELIITYENTASPAIGNSGVYKNYARILLPLGATISGIRLYEADGSYKDLEYDLINTEDRKEAGIIIEVLPSTTKRVQIVWITTTDILKQGGEYNLKVLKQAGTEADILNVNIVSSDLTLTGRRLSKYNTNLREDFKTRIFFKPYEN